MNNHHLEDFIDDVWRITPCRLAEKLTGGKFKRYSHIQFISKRIAQTILEGNGRLIISMPPRHGKSWLTSLWTPVWFLSLFPDRNVLLATYESEFSAHWGRQVRNLISEHSMQLGIKLTDDSKAADRWNTPEGGGMFTTGIGGPITGRGGNLIIVDDPVKNQEQASSQTYRERAIDWFNSTLYTRAEPGATMIVLMTRWHQGDLAGYLLTEEQNSWEEIRLPAIAEEGDQLGRQLGQALCPERFDEETLQTMQIQVGSRVWNALYQQRPSAEEGNIFRREWWKFYSRVLEYFDQMIQSWDMAFKETKGSDFVVGQVWGTIGADKYLIDQVRARMDFTSTIRAVRSLSEKYPRAILKLVEDKANGPAVISALEHEISGLVAVEPEGSKEARAHSVTPYCEAGNVYLPHWEIMPWITDYIEELANFPNGTHDDQVDATTQALRRLDHTFILGTPMSMPSPFRFFDVF